MPRPTETHKGCLVALPNPPGSGVGGRHRASGAPTPSSWAGPGAGRDFNLLGHHPAGARGQREDNPNLLIKPTQSGAPQAPHLNSTQGLFVSPELGSLQPLHRLCPLPGTPCSPCLGKCSFSFRTLFREHLFQEALLTPGLPTKRGVPVAHMRMPSTAQPGLGSQTLAGPAEDWVSGYVTAHRLSRISGPKITLWWWRGGG